MDDIQEGAVSQETTSQEGEASQEESAQKAETQPQTLTAEQIQKMIGDALAEQNREFSKTKQSLNDRITHLQGKLSEKSQAADTSGSVLDAFRDRLKDSDPEALKELELAELRARDQQYRQRETEQQQESQRVEFDKKFHGQLGELLDGFGIDPADERIDWGNDSKDYLEKQGRIFASINKIRGEQVAEEKTQRAKELEDFKNSLRKELGLDSVDTTNPIATSSDDAWLVKWGDGEIDATPENMARAKKLMKTKYGG